MSSNDIEITPISNDQLATALDESRRRLQVRRLMALGMPPTEKYVAHIIEDLRGQFDKAEALTPERSALLDTYQEALLAATGEYEAAIAKIITESFTAEEVEALIFFFSNPLHLAVAKFQHASMQVNNVGMLWTTKVLERCPETWKMLINGALSALEQALPPGAANVTVPDGPAGTDGWTRVADQPTEAAEFIPAGSSAEEAELAALRGGDEPPPAAS